PSVVSIEAVLKEYRHPRLALRLSCLLEARGCPLASAFLSASGAPVCLSELVYRLPLLSAVSVSQLPSLLVYPSALSPPLAAVMSQLLSLLVYPSPSQWAFLSQ